MGSEENPNARLLAFSDGVIAVAITLLVLDIRLPEEFADFSDAQLGAALGALWPRFFAYLLSFAVIGSFWINHRAKFERIVASDGRLLWINMLFLLTVGLVPFTTNLIAENGGALSTAIYAGTMVASGLTLLWIWGHAAGGKLIDPAMSGKDVRRQVYSTVLVTAVFALSMPLAFVHADIAKYFWLLLIPANLIVRVVAPRTAGAKAGK